MAISSSNILGAAEKEFTDGVTGTDRLAADKGTFLKLLVAQLSNQDPLNPTEDKEFITQLAQFTSLEQLQDINAGVENLNTTMNQSQLLSATSFIGKSIIAEGSQITKYEGVIDGETKVMTTDLAYILDRDMKTGVISIFDSKGSLIFSDTLPPKSAGAQIYQWTGLNSEGRVVPDGTYEVRIYCEDADGKAIMPSTQFVGQVVGVENGDGIYSLLLAGGRTVPFTSVVEIYQNATDTGSGSSGGSSNEEKASAAAGQALLGQTSAEAAKAQAETYRDLALNPDATDDAVKKNAASAKDAAEKAATAATMAEVAAAEAKIAAEAAKTDTAYENLEKAQNAAKAAREAADAAYEAYEAAQAAADARG